MDIHHQIGEMLSVVWPHMQQLHAMGDRAPIAACVNQSGEIRGLAIIIGDKQAKGMSVQEGLTYFENTLREAIAKGEIVASGIFFHGVTPDEPLRPAQSVEEASTLVSLLEHESGGSLSIVIPYQVSGDEIQYGEPIFAEKPPAVFGS